MRPFALAVTIAVALASALAASPAAALGRVRGDGRTITQPRELTGTFDEIELRGPVDARVRVGPPQAVSVTIDSNLQSHVLVRVVGRKLRIDTDARLDHHGEAYVTVTLPTLRALGTEASGDAVIVDERGGGKGDLSLATSGSGDLRWTGEAATLSVSTSGSGDATLAGKAASLSAQSSGSGDVDARALTVHDANVQTSGTGDAELTLSGGTLSAQSSGTGDVTWYGEASNVETHVSGSGEVRRR